MNHTTSPLAQLSQAGVSIWLDDLSRQRIVSGGLRDLITNRNVVGVTTNPTIFAAALSAGEGYAEQVRELAQQGASAADAITAITTQDVANACDIFAPVFEATDGQDGRVSIEVEPGLAHDAAATIAQAADLWKLVDRPNVMIKIPATLEGLEAITATIAAGISVNVTLIFSLDRYRAVIEAYELGLEKALAAGIDISGIRSVASFFVSRVDTEIDKRLRQLGTDDALALVGKAAVANARLAYEVFESSLETERWKALAEAGARPQRPLWASTGVKDPAMPDTEYVVELVTQNVVNTMPEKTIEAVYDHGVIRGDTVRGEYGEAHDILAAVERVGVSYDDVVTVLEAEGVDKFIASWNQLVASVEDALKGALA